MTLRGRPSDTRAEPISFVETGSDDIGLLPQPHYVRLPTLVLWVAGPSLGGVFSTARHPLSELQDAQRLYLRLYEPPNARALYTDLRAFEAEREMLAAILEGATSRIATARPTRASMVLGEGWLRAWWIGVVAMRAFNTGPARAFTHTSAAWRWVGAPEPVSIAVDALTAQLSPGRELRSQLQALLQLEPALTLEDAARKLGLSSRTLQRALRDEGVRFAELRDRSRAEIAAARLSRTDDKIDAVASDTGFRSRSHFVTWFRRLTSTTPAEFRAQHRTSRDGT
jgi:AraC-like DNA-binding protein